MTTNLNAQRAYWKWILVLAGISALLILMVVFKVPLFLRDQLRNVLAWIQAIGPWGPLLFILVYVVACVICIPASILTLGAGIVFGVVQGSIYTSIAATLGATAS